MRLMIGFWILIVLSSCAASEVSTTSTSASSSVTQSARPPRADLEGDVFTVFSGNDAGAMSALGQRLESERPNLSVGLLERMLTFQHEHLTDDSGLRMMRPMLFRTVAVIIGAPARPTLQNCINGGADLDRLCEDTLREIDARN
jgi:hypothetical protein